MIKREEQRRSIDGKPLWLPCLPHGRLPEEQVVGTWPVEVGTAPAKLVDLPDGFAVDGPLGVVQHQQSAGRKVVLGVPEACRACTPVHHDDVEGAVSVDDRDVVAPGPWDPVGAVVDVVVVLGRHDVKLPIPGRHACDIFPPHGVVLDGNEANLSVEEIDRRPSDPIFEDPAAGPDMAIEALQCGVGQPRLPILDRVVLLMNARRSPPGAK